MSIRTSWILLILLTHGWTSYGQPRQCGTVDHNTSYINSISDSFTAHSRSDFIVPLVFHLVTNSINQDISDEHVIKQLQILNDAFSGQLSDHPRLPQAFRDVQGITGIRFCLASTDPSGNISTGIIRTNTTVENIADQIESDGRRRIHYSDLGGQTAWDTERYINVWVGSSSLFAGKSTFPDVGQNSEEDGIIIDPDFFGSYITGDISSPFHLGKTLIHEMGHYFNLIHIWGSGSGGDCQTDDGIEDTPLQRSPYNGCPEAGQQSCGSDDMFYNYMDFTNDDCLLMFTLDQSAIMVQTLMSLRSALLNGNACANINTINPTRLSAYHMPYDNYLQISFDGGDGQIVKYLLYDINGRLLLSQSSTVFERDFLPIPSLQTGIYILYAILDGDPFIEKILVVN